MPDITPKIDPKRAALLVMDYQAGIIDMIERPDELLATAQHATCTARTHGAHVGYVRVAFTDEEYDAIPESNKGFWSSKSLGRDFRAESAATAIDANLAPNDGDIIVRKRRVGAFSTTDLAEHLRSRGVHTLILAGISTSGVVLSTVRDAADRDYRLFVLSDACADPRADVHAFLMEQIFPRQADVITARDLDALLG